MVNLLFSSVGKDRQKQKNINGSKKYLDELIIEGHKK